VNITLTPRPLTAAERDAGWSHVYESTPRISGPIYTDRPMPADPMSAPDIATLARITGYAFTLA
jgi:hypothetical protein